MSKLNEIFANRISGLCVFEEQIAKQYLVNGITTGYAQVYVQASSFEDVQTALRIAQYHHLEVSLLDAESHLVGSHTPCGGLILDLSLLCTNNTDSHFPLFTILESSDFEDTTDSNNVIKSA